MSRDISHKFHSEPHTCAASANALHGEGVYAAHPKPRHARKSTIQAIDVDFASFIHLDGSKEAAALTRKCSDHAKANARLISQCLTPQSNSWMCGPASLETAFAFLSGGKKDPRLSQSAILAHMQGHLPLQNGVGSTQMLQVLGRGLRLGLRLALGSGFGIRVRVRGIVTVGLSPFAGIIDRTHPFLNASDTYEPPLPEP